MKNFSVMQLGVGVDMWLSCHLFMWAESPSLDMWPFLVMVQFPVRVKSSVVLKLSAESNI